MHGWGGSVKSFEGIAKALSDRFRCVLVDFAGFGDTPEPNKIYTLSDYTNDLDALLDRLNIGECIFIAHSFGGRVAIDYITSERKTKIQGAVLTDSAGLKPRRNIKYYIKVISYKIKKKLGLDVSSSGSSDYKTLSPIMKGTFVNIVNEYLDKRLNNIHIPILLVWGDNDKDTPMYMARKMEKCIKGSAIVIFKNRGHFAYLEESRRFILIVKSFAEGIE